MSTPEITPGRWHERGGGVARVVGRDKRRRTYPWHGTDSLGWPSVWTSDGWWLPHGAQHDHDLVEYLGPLDDDT